MVVALGVAVAIQKAIAVFTSVVALSVPQRSRDQEPGFYNHFGYVAKRQIETGFLRFAHAWKTPYNQITIFSGDRNNRRVGQETGFL